MMVNAYSPLTHTNSDIELMHTQELRVSKVTGLVLTVISAMIVAGMCQSRTRPSAE